MGVKRGAACRSMTCRSSVFREESRLSARERSARSARIAEASAPERGARTADARFTYRGGERGARCLGTDAHHREVRGSVWAREHESRARSAFARQTSWHTDAWRAREETRGTSALELAKRPPRHTPGLAVVHPGSSASVAMSPATRADAGCVEVMALQPIAVVDHLGPPVSSDFLRRNLLAIGGGELGGSERVDPSTLASLLSKLEAAGADVSVSTKAGGSAADTARGLSRGFGVKAGLLGSVGDDEWGSVFKDAMRAARVDVSNLSEKPGATGRCACFVEAGSGQRTMRTCLRDAVRLDAREIRARLGEAAGSNPLRGASWVLIPGYAFYGDGLVAAAAAAAAEANCKVALALASFEIVRAFGAEIEALMRSGRVSAVFANEDEAREVVALGSRSEEKSRSHPSIRIPRSRDVRVRDDRGPRAGHLRAVVPRVRRGGHARRPGVRRGAGRPRVRNERARRLRAAAEVVARDSTGAGDLFVSGFMYGLLRESPRASARSWGAPGRGRGDAERRRGGQRRGMGVGARQNAHHTVASHIRSPRAAHPAARSHLLKGYIYTTTSIERARAYSTARAAEPRARLGVTSRASAAAVGPGCATVPSAPTPGSRSGRTASCSPRPCPRTRRTDTALGPRTFCSSSARFSGDRRGV